MLSKCVRERKHKEGDERKEKQTKRKSPRKSNGAQKIKKGTAGLLLFTSEKVRKHSWAIVTAANHVRLCPRKAVIMCFTQSSLTHYPIEQLYNALGYKLFSCEGNWLFQCAKKRIKRETSCPQYFYGNLEVWGLTVCLYL